MPMSSGGYAASSSGCATRPKAQETGAREPRAPHRLQICQGGEGANKTYGTRGLITEETNRLPADSVETREIDSVLVVGKPEPQRIFELLGRKGEVAPERLALRDAFVEALDAYRSEAWEKAHAGFEECLAISPCDPPSKV